MKKTILTAIVATFLMSSCHKPQSFMECKGSYTEDGIKYKVMTKKGKCFIHKGVTTFGYKQIPKEHCECL